jgi:tRNA (guanine-N7-)-methyltransferase
MDVIRKGGFIEFKTDNAGLFDFTLEEIKALGYEIDEMSEDLHECDGLDDCDGLGDDEETAFDGAGASARFRTEYEEKFMKKGVKIKFVRLIK